MNEFTKIRKSRRRVAVEKGIIRRVVEMTGMDKSTVSRTFAGKIDNPNPEIAAALKLVLAELGIQFHEAA